MTMVGMVLFGVVALVIVGWELMKEKKHPSYTLLDFYLNDQVQFVLIQQVAQSQAVRAKHLRTMRALLLSGTVRNKPSIEQPLAKFYHQLESIDYPKIEREVWVRQENKIAQLRAENQRLKTQQLKEMSSKQQEMPQELER